LDSFTLPLWLVFANADPFGRPIYVIYKRGDDLRQDVLTLQMLGFMDKIWKGKKKKTDLI
jgi:phosphatidylinositol-4,5-bisphosphate 3-kinase